MSAAVRQAIADAANSVAGVGVTPYYDEPTDVGHGSVFRDRTEYPDKFGGVVHWRVVVRAPSDLAGAETYLDEKGPALRAALAGVMAVTAVTPAPLGDGLAVVIEGHREEE